MSSVGERVITIPDFAPTDVAVVDPADTVGVLIVGMAQAGKTTFRDIVCETWETFDPEGLSLPFANSDGFRGVTYRALMHAGVDIEQPVEAVDYASILEEYLRGADIESELAQLYAEPLDESLLRNPAVDSVVTMSAEHRIVRPATNQAGAQLLQTMLRDYDAFAMAEKPALIVLDTRNRGEGEHKFASAGVRMLGTFVLTCPEDVIASRKPGVSADRLRLRNATDRNRDIAKMTLPEDFATTFIVDEIMDNETPFTHLLDAGFTVASRDDAAIVIRTDRLTLDQERTALEPILHGMLAAHSS